MEAKIVKEMPPRGMALNACIVEYKGRHYLVSSADVLYSGFETLVFLANKEGKVVDWMEVAGGRGMSREEAIADLMRVR